MVVLGRDENVAIETVDLSGPHFGVRHTVLPERRRHRLVEKREVEIFFVPEFEPGVAALFPDFLDPLGYTLAISTQGRASDNDPDLFHFTCLFAYAFEFAQYH